MEIERTKTPVPEAAGVAGSFSNTLRAFAVALTATLAGAGLVGCSSQEKAADSGAGAETTKAPSGPSLDDFSSATKKGLNVAKTAAGIFKGW